MDLASLIKPEKKESVSIAYDDDHYKSKSFISQFLFLFLFLFLLLLFFFVVVVALAQCILKIFN